jgi:hypothetical protein
VRRKAGTVRPRVISLPVPADMTRLDLSVIECTMLWPSDVRQWRRARERSIVEHFKQVGELNEVDKAGFFWLADQAHPLPAIQADARKPFLHGMIAGKVLHNVLGLIACDPDNASLGKAIKMALPAAKQLSSSTFNCTISSSTFNNTIWRKFRCVAHLWAAAFARAVFDDRRDFPCVVGDLPAFLADAEGYRVMGESRRTKQSPGKAILLAGETIRFLPEGLAIEPTDLRFEMEPGRKL